MARRANKKANANHLLNFSLPERVPVPAYVPSYTPSDYRRAINASFYSNERFLQANFQFVVSEDFFENASSHEQPSVEWDKLKLVIYSTTQEYQCPICLDHPVAAKTTKCGHIYCWTCLLHLFEASFATPKSNSSNSVTLDCPGGTLEVQKRYKQCPICTEMISLHTLKDVKILTQHHYQENQTCDFFLIKRNRNSTIPRPNLGWNEQSSFIYPYYNEFGAEFSRFLLESPNRPVEGEVFQSHKQQLETALADAIGVDRSYIQLALQLLDNQFNFLSDLRDSKHASTQKTKSHSSSIEENGGSAEQSSYAYFYQETAGAKVFLHPVCMRGFLQEFQTHDKLPNKISGRVLEIEEITLTEASKKRYKYLSHLPLSTICYLVEIDMTQLISKSSLSVILPKINERQAAREKKKRMDEEEKQRADVPLCQLPNLYDDVVGFVSRPQPEILIEIDRSVVGPPKQWVPNASPTAASAVRSSASRVINPPVTQATVVSFSTPNRAQAKMEDEEDEEERKAPSFTMSFAQALNTVDPPAAQESGQKGRKKKQRQKQLLFSTAQRTFK